MCSSACEQDSIRPGQGTTAAAGSEDGSLQTTRRGAIRLGAGGGVLALIASGMGSRPAVALQATPAPARSKEGHYTVIRSRTVKPDMSIDELNAAIRDGLVPLIAAIPGFVEYSVVQNPDTRERIAVGVFLDKTGADESTTVASEFITGEGLADYYENAEPVVLEGEIVVAST